MEQSASGRPVKEYLHPPVLGFGRRGVFGVFDPLHGRPEPGAYGAVARVGSTAQADALFRTLDIRQFGSFDPLESGPRLIRRSAESIDETKDPIKNRADT